MWTVVLILAIGIIIYPLIFIGPAILIKYDKDIEDILPIFKKQNCPRYLEGNAIYFPSRRSLMLTVVIWLLLLTSLTLTGFSRQLYPFLIVLSISLLALWFDSTTGYTINDTHILIKAAFFRWKVELTSLKKISRSNNPVSSPALSLKRMEIIATNGNFIVISPVEEELFLKILKDRSPNLIICNSRLSIPTTVLIS